MTTLIQPPKVLIATGKSASEVGMWTGAMTVALAVAVAAWAWQSAPRPTMHTTGVSRLIMTKSLPWWANWSGRTCGTFYSIPEQFSEVWFSCTQPRWKQSLCMRQAFDLQQQSKRRLHKSLQHRRPSCL